MGGWTLLILEVTGQRWRSWWTSLTNVVCAAMLVRFALFCVDTTESNTSVSYLDLLLSIGRDGQLHSSIYDKRDEFNFHITNFPFLSSNIPTSPSYGVFISQLIWYARACSSYGCFILRPTRLSNKFLEQGYFKERLKSSFRKFYGRYGNLIKQYEVSLSQMLNDMLWPDHIQWQPLLIRICTELDLLPNFERFP